MELIVATIIICATVLAYSGALSGDQYVQIVMSIIAGIFGWKAGEAVMKFRLGVVGAGGGR